MATLTARKSCWQVQVRRHGFKPLSKHFKTSVDARTWARTVEAEMDRGVRVDRSNAEKTTLSDILQRYKKAVTAHKRGKKQEESRINVVSTHPIVCQTRATLRVADFADYREDRLQQVSGSTVNTFRPMRGYLRSLSWSFISSTLNAAPHARRPSKRGLCQITNIGLSDN